MGLESVAFGGVYTYQLSVRLNIGGVDQYLILAEYETGVLWNRILFTMLLMKCDDKITYYNAPLAYPCICTLIT